MISAAELARLKELCAKATPGPWRKGWPSFRCKQKHDHDPKICKYEFDRWYDDHEIWVDKEPQNYDDESGRIAGQWDYESGGIVKEDDSEFIAAARTAVPALLAEVERLRAECFSLAANQCHDGYAGEHGHHMCREVERLQHENATCAAANMVQQDKTRIERERADAAEKELSEALLYKPGASTSLLYEIRRELGWNDKTSLSIMGGGERDLRKRAEAAEAELAALKAELEKRT